MADDIVKTSKQTVDAIDAIEQKLKKFQETANKTDYFKSISKFSEEINSVTDNVSSLGKNLNSMGINSESALKGVMDKVTEVTAKFKNLADTTKDFSKVQGKIKDVKNILDLMNKKSLNIDDIKKYKDVLSSLGSELDPKDFTALRTAIATALDTGNVNAFKKQMEETGPAVFKSMNKNLKSLKGNQEVFGSLSKEAQEYIQNFYKIGQKVKTIDDLKNAFGAVEASTLKLNEELDVLGKGTAEGLTEETKKVQEEIESIEKKVSAQEQFKNYYESIKAEFGDMVNHLNQQSHDLDLIPEEKFGTQFDYIDELQKQIAAKMLEIGKINNSIFNEKNPEKIEELNEKLRSTQAEIKKNKNEIREVAGQIESWQKAYSTSPLQKYIGAHVLLGDKVRNASAGTQHLANLVSQRFPPLGKMVQDLSNKFSSIANNSKQFQISAGLIAGSFTLLKAVTAIEKKTAGVFKEIINSGLIMNTNAEDTTSAMRNLGITSENTGGLLKAAFKSEGSFALGREEIMGTVSALNQAGLASKNLEKQMKPVMGSITGTKNELVGAATMVKVFSTNLGIADGEVANLMGNMASEFNSTMGSLQDNFTAITSAVQSSSMSSVRFLGILGTSTAGLSLYAEQVEATARSITKLDRNTSLSQKGIENFTKSAAEAALDTQKFATNMAVYLRQGGAKEVSKSLAASLSKIDAKIIKQGPETEDNKKILAELKGQKKNTLDMIGYLEKGDFLNAAELARYVSPEENLKMQGQILSSLVEQGKGNPLLTRQLAQQAGMEKMYDEYMKLDAKDREKLLKAVEAGDTTAEKAFKDMQEKASEAQKYTGEGLGKLIESIIGTSNIWLGSITGILTGIATLMAAGGGLKGLYDIFKTWRGGGGYKGGGGGIGLLKTAEGAAKSSGGFMSSVGKMGEKLMSSGMVQSITKSAPKLLGGIGKSLGKFVPGVGLAMASKDIFDFGSKAFSEEGVTTKDFAQLGLSITAGIAGIVPGIGTAISLAATAGSLALDAIPEGNKTAQAPQKIDPLVNNQNLGSIEKSQALKAMANSAGNYIEKIENNFVYNIKGEDEQRIKKMIMEGVQEGIRYIQQGSGKSK